MMAICIHGGGALKLVGALAVVSGGKPVTTPLTFTIWPGKSTFQFPVPQSTSPGFCF